MLYPYRIIGVYEYDKQKIDNVFDAVKKKYTSFNHMKEEQILPSLDETARSCHTIVRGGNFGNVNTQRDYDYAFSRCMDTYGVKRTQYIGESLNVSDVNDTNTLNYFMFLWTKNTHNTHYKDVVQRINLIAYKNGEDKVTVYLALHPKISIQYYAGELVDLNNFVLTELKRNQLKRIDIKMAEVLIDTK